MGVSGVLHRNPLTLGGCEWGVAQEPLTLDGCEWGVAQEPINIRWV